MVSVTCSNPRRIRRGEKRALKLLNSDIEKSKDKLFFIMHRAAVSSQDECYLVQDDRGQSYLVTMRDYGVYW